MTQLKKVALEAEWNKFSNNIGQRLLPIVDNIFGGLSYDLPKPGGVIIDNKLLLIQFSWFRYKVYT